MEDLKHLDGILLLRYSILTIDNREGGGIGNAYICHVVTSRRMLDTDFTMDCMHFRCTITHLCSSLVPKECYPYLVSVRNEQRVSKKCRVREHALRAIHTVHLWDFTMDCVHFRCTIKHLCSSLVPKECYPYLVSVRNKQRVSKKCCEP